MADEKIYKIALLGDAGCGKTNWVHRIINGEFEKRYLATLGVEVSPISLNTNEGKFNLSVWDIAGQDKYSNLKDGYCQNTDAAIIFFDTTSKLSFRNLKFWIDNFLEVSPNAKIVVVGNKVDIRERKVSFSVIKQALPNITYFDISVKSNYNFEKPLVAVLRKITGICNLNIVEEEEIISKL